MVLPAEDESALRCMYAPTAKCIPVYYTNFIKPKQFAEEKTTTNLHTEIE